MPTGASPAKGLVERASAGRRADLNSSHRDDHSTSRWGSGHSATVSGMVSSSGITTTYSTLRTHAGLAHSLNPDGASPGFPRPDRARRESAIGAPRKTA